MMHRLLLFVIISLLFALGKAKANEVVYWIQLADKNNSTYSLSQPEQFLSARAIARRQQHNIAIDTTDFPVNKHYIDSLTSLGFSIKHTSRWMNGVIALLPHHVDIESVFKPSFVQFYQLRKPAGLKSSKTDKFDVSLVDEDSEADAFYGRSYAQVALMNGHKVHEYSKGRGVHVAVIDAGFMNADTHPAFASLYGRGGVLGTFDFVSPGNNVYNEHAHGTMVLSTMAANVPGEMIGTAPEASYWLFRTEDVRSEYPVEEDYWIIATEFADSVGCQVINTSLGYYVFDDPNMNYTYNQLDGKTLRIARAANMAVEKGMLLFCSAGNEGYTSWRHIVTPSDAVNVFSVAAVDSNGQITGFSSHGFGKQATPPKPDIAAMGTGVRVANGFGSYNSSSGTSFASPLAAGMAACIVALMPELTAIELGQKIRESADRFPKHDSLYGYGICDFYKLVSQSESVNSSSAFQTKLVAYPNPFSSQLIMNVPNNAMLSIFSANGKLVLKKYFVGEQAYVVSPAVLNALHTGVYIANIRSKNHSQTIKLIKQ